MDGLSSNTHSNASASDASDDFWAVLNVTSWCRVVWSLHSSLCYS